MRSEEDEGVGVIVRWRRDVGSGSSRLENGVVLRYLDDNPEIELDELGIRLPPGTGIRLGDAGRAFAHCDDASEKLEYAGEMGLGMLPAPLTDLPRLILDELLYPAELDLPLGVPLLEYPNVFALSGGLDVWLSLSVSFSSLLVDMFHRGFEVPSLLGDGDGARRADRGGACGSERLWLPKALLTLWVARWPGEGGCWPRGGWYVPSELIERLSLRGGRGGDGRTVAAAEGRVTAVRVGVAEGEERVDLGGDGRRELPVTLFASRRRGDMRPMLPFDDGAIEPFPFCGGVSCRPAAS